MTPQEHYDKAEQLLEQANHPDNHPDGSRFYLGMAQVHATLATATLAETVYVEVANAGDLR